MSALYETIEEAQGALETAAADVAADMGEDAVEAAWGDLVRDIATFCSAPVRDDLLRRNL